MLCPKCHHVESKVIDSRTAHNDSAIRRRRECLACGHRFTTYEVVEAPLMVIKKTVLGKTSTKRRSWAASGMPAARDLFR